MYLDHVEVIQGHLNQLYSELERGIESLDDDDQILAVVIMRLGLKRIEDMNRILAND